jgi:hypothetical protein
MNAVDMIIYVVQAAGAYYPTSTRELSYIAQDCMSLRLFPDPSEEVSTRSFYSSRMGSYSETRGLTGGPYVVETLYNI